MSKLILSIGIFFLSIYSLHAQTFNGTGGTIPDGGAQTCFNINVTGVGNINGTYGLASVCLNINHTWDEDLEIYLKAPDGTLVPLSIQNGFAGVNYTNTCFTATAATSIVSGTAPYTGSFLPEGNLGSVNNGQNANGVWSLCIQDLFTPDQGTLLNWSILFNNTPAPPPVPPANDNPCNATPLTVGAGCSYSIHTNENATGTTGVPAPGCANYAGGDVWFSAVVPAGGGLIFDTQTGTLTDGAMAVYSGTCGAMTLIACDNNSSNNGAMPMINATGLTPGSTVWIRFWDPNNDESGTFGICVTTPPPAPTNDEACTAFSLAVNNSCNYSTFTNVGATTSTGAPAPGCGSFQGSDVWFTVTVPPGGTIIFDSNTGTMTDGDMAIYRGTCNALTLLACDDLSSANGQMASITLTGQTPGATLWVRFWGYGTNNTGTFQICASTPPPPTVQDCPAANAICQNVYSEPISYSGTGSLGNEINPANSCLTSGERADVWYTFTVTSSGNLNFTITPNDLTEDYDWAVYNLTSATCSDIYNNAALNVSCNFSSTPGTTGPTGGSASTSQGAGGTPYNALIPVTAGQTYVINVSNYSLSTNGYVIDFGASTASIFDNIPPHLQSINSAINCGGSQVSVNFSENILCSTIQNADFTITGPGGPYTVTSWTSVTCASGATYANNVVLTVSPALVTNGNYQVCLTSASGSVTDLCGNVAPAGCLNFTIASTVPTFNPVAPVCNGSAAPTLPTTSLNGFSGTWSPSTVSSTATGTYTFTPNIGQCATPTTLTVTVTAAGTVPAFNAIPAFCSGTAAPTLPATSTNGVTGTWAPATVSNTASGTYTFTPGVGQCATTATLSVTVNAGTIPTFAPVPAICSGTAVPVLPTTSTNGITGTWNPATVSNTASTTYTFTPTAGQCASTTTLTVTVNPLPVIYTHGTNPSCAGTCDGTAAVDVVGGTPNYTYTWSNSGITQTITGLCAGTYTVTVTDANGCASLPGSPAVPGCFQIQSAMVDACSATEYDQEMVFFQVGQNPLNTSPMNVTWPTAADTWNGLCTDPSFISSVNATITGGGSLLPLPASGILPANANVVLISSNSPATSANSFANLNGPLYAIFQCAGNTQGHFGNYSATPGIRTLAMNFGAACTDTVKYDVSLLINQNGTTGGSTTLNNGAFVNYAANGNATYLNNSCAIPYTIETSQVILVAPPQTTPTFAAIAAICSGASAPTLPTTSTNGITGTWSPIAVSNTASGTYTFTPTAGQCATTTTLSVTVNNQTTPNFAAIAAICSGSAAAVLPTTSTNGITGTWSPATVSNTASGTYTFTPAAGQCATTTTLSVTVNNQTTPTFAAVVAICSGSTAPVLPTTSSNGITGTWSPATVSNTASGTYTFTPTAGQCATTTTLSVTVNAQTIPVFLAVAPICKNSVSPILPASSTNGITGTWSPATVSNTTSGTYTFTPNAGQCATSTTLSVTVNTPATPTFAAVPAICSGSAAPVLPTTSSNGITGTWAPATVSNTTSGTYTFTPTAGQCATTTTLSVSVNNQTTPTFAAVAAICSGSAAPVLSTTSSNGITGTWSPATVSNTASGTYTFTPTAGQCATTTTLSVTVNNQTTPTFAAIAAICSGSVAPVLPTTSTNGTTGTWSPATVSNTASGTYMFTPTAGQCATTTTLSVTVNNQTTPTFAAVAAICSGAAAPVLPTTSSNGITGTWSPATVSNTASGTYTFTPTAGQCATTTTLSVTVNNQTTPTFAAIAAICSGSVAPVLPTTSTNGTTGTWSPATVSNTASGTYMFTPTAGQCATTTTLSVTVINQTTPTFAAIAAICSGAAAPTLPTTSTNGITGTWSPATVSNTASGTYTFTPTAGQCAKTTTLSVTVNNQTTPTFAAVAAICSGAAAPVLPITSSNGITGTWSPATVSNTASGTYTFTPTAGQCATTTTLSVTINNQTTPTFAAVVAICSGTAAPVLSTTSSNGITGTWSPATVSNTASGTYTFTPTAGQCATTTTLSVTINNQTIPTFAAVVAICSGSTAPVLATTSTNGITGTWSPATVSNTTSGTYTFTPTAGQCATTTTLSVTVNAQTIPVFLAVAPICKNSVSPILPTTSTNGITGTWSPATVSNTTSGTYTFTPNAGQCATSTTLSVTVNTPATPTFAAVPAVCSGSAAPVLPTTSSNGITGTWAPATVSNTTSGTYTFTPGAGQCATTTTLPVTVKSILTSTTNTTICSNQLPYSWNAQSYPIAGTYSVTLAGSNGCDSVATLVLSVNNTLTSSTNTTICSNQLPYSWNGNTYPIAGTYSVTLVSAAGCDSVATLNLAVNNTLTSTTNHTVCSNQLPYVWNAQSYSTAGPHAVTLISVSGCDSVATLNLMINPVVTSTTNHTICSNQLPYVWNGQSYSTGGAHSVTLVSNAGCDSIATLNLIIIPVATSTTNTVICSNRLPYSWNGQSYSTGGAHTVTLFSSTGCDSVATLNLTVNNTLTSTTNTTICSNQLPYSWNGNAYPIAGTYSVTLVSSAGCDSVATLNLTVNNTLTSTTNTTICSNQLPYSWNGNAYPIAGTYSVTLVSAAGCDSVATLNLTVNNTLTSTTNTTICSNQLPYSWNGNAYPIAGTYSVTLVSSAGCDSVATLNLTVNNTLTSTTNTTICSNQLPYSWNGNAYPIAGTYSVTLVSSAGCDSVATLNLTVNNTLTSTTNTTICSNQLPYSWNGNAYPIAGTYSVTLVSSAGCDSIATLNLTVNNTLTSTTNTIICSNQLPYSWNGNAYPIAGTYSVTLVSSAGCDSVATLNLTVNNTLTSTTNTTICSNQLPYSWNGNAYPIAGTYSVTLVSAAGCDSVATLNLTVNNTLTSTTNKTICSNQLPYSWNGNAYPIAGTYSVTLVSSAGCDSIATLNLTVNNTLTSTTNKTICSNQLPYSWNGNAYPIAGTYSVTLVSAAGCDSVATLNLTVNNILTSTTNTIICSNQLPYSWNGQSYSTGGAHTVTLVSAAGCDSVATLNLTVNNTLTSTTNSIICSNQLPYLWNGQSYSIGGAHTVTLFSSTGCDSVATLNLTVNNTLTSTTNTIICSNQLPYSWNGNAYPIAGTYSVTLVSAAGCDSVATLNLTVNNTLTSTTNTTICSNQLPYSWNGNAYPIAGTYSVTLVSSAGCDSVATLNLTVNNTLTSTTNKTICSNQLPYSWNGNAYPIAGTYSVTLVSSAGCDSVATLNLTVNNILTSTTNTIICSNQLPYSWNGNAYPIAGTYSVTLVSAAGCDSVATLNLTVNNTLTSTTNTIICSNQLPYSWNGNAYPIAGTYSVTLVSSAGCDSVATLNLTVNNTLTSTTNTIICSNQLPYSWNGNAYPIAGTYSVTLVSSAGCDSVATLNLTVNNTLTSTTNTTICSNQLPYSWNGNAYPIAGTYSVTLVSAAGCDSVATLNLTVNNTLTSTTNKTICSNQLPYSWNGNVYPIAGTYSVTLVSAAVCDSVATLNLTVNNTLTSTTNTTICSNQLPYSWNGNAYPIAGIYSVTLVSAAGCDSIATLNLIINPVVTSNTSKTICSNQLPFLWNGQSYSTPGSHSVTLVSSLGCDSVATLNLIINPVVTSNTSKTICSNQLPFLWNGQSYSTPGSHSVTLVSSLGCDSIATLNLIINPVVTSNTSKTICSNQLPFLWNGQSYSTPGAHSVTLVSSLGCDSVATLNLIINPVASSNTIKTICSNQLPFLWNGQSYSTPGSHSVTLTSAAGCDSVATLHLTINPVVSSTTNVSVCSNLLPYVWNGNSYVASGAHIVTLVSSAGCDSVATLNLTINQSPGAPVVTTPVSYCQYEKASPLNAIATGSNQLLWYTAANGGTGSTTAPVPPTNSVGTFSYYVSQTNGTCESPGTLINVRINVKPVLGPDQSLKICFGNTANLNTLYNTTGLTTNWTTNNNPIINPANITVSGNYQLIVTTVAGCLDTATVALTIQPPVIANAGPDGNAEYNAAYQLNGSGGVQYLWSPASPLNNPNIANPTALLTNDTQFVLMVMDEIGCKDYDTVKIRVFKGPTFYVPTAFTPNGDGINDIFRPTAVGIASMEYFRVYNRYGEMVYETSDVTKGWDGTYKGVRQNTGNFVWTLKGVDRRGDTKVMKGYVVLIR